MIKLPNYFGIQDRITCWTKVSAFVYSSVIQVDLSLGRPYVYFPTHYQVNILHNVHHIFYISDNGIYKIENKNLYMWVLTYLNNNLWTIGSFIDPAPFFLTSATLSLNPSAHFDTSLSKTLVTFVIHSLYFLGRQCRKCRIYPASIASGYLEII